MDHGRLDHVVHHARFERLPASILHRLGNDPGAAPEPLLQWATGQLAGLATPVVGPPAGARIRHWSAVLQLPTTAGDVFVKANAAGFGHEAGLLDLLARRAPGTVIAPLAVDIGRGWLILPDGGPTLADQPLDDPAGAWRDLLTGYGRVQRRLMPLADQAARLGVPDVRADCALSLLPAAILAASDPVHGEHALSQAEGERLLAAVPVLAELAGELAGSPVPCSIEHNDPHPGNMFARSRLLFDFGDAVVGHPFLGLAGGLRHAAEDLPGAAGIPLLRRAYLEAFADLGPADRLHRDAEVAGVLRYLPRAATWLRTVREARAVFPAYLPAELRELQRGLRALTARAR